MDTARPITIRVMVFNIENGGTEVDLAKVIEAIRLADPDIVALEEAMGNTARIAAALGWPAASARTHVLSRYRLIESPAADGRFIYVEVKPGRAVAIVNVHLPAEPFGPAVLAAGGSVAVAVQLEEKVRLEPLRRSLAVLPDLAAQEVPAFLLGDFNAPLDLDWPVTRALAEAGLRDTWREIHPDALAEPGLTWPAARPPIGHDDPVPGGREDRIDGIFAVGSAITLDCRLVGETGGREVAVSVEPWPSDHRAIVATFRVRPGAMPDFVPVDESATRDPGTRVELRTARPIYRVGEPIEVSWAGGPANRWDWIGVFQAGDRAPNRHLVWIHTGARTAGTNQLAAAAAVVDQSPLGGHWPLPPGSYEAAYLLDDSDERVASIGFSIVA